MEALMSERAIEISGHGTTAEVQGNTRKVFVKTYGCQMNVYDSVRMTDALAADGYAETADIEEADLVLLNTCHIREKAAEKVYSELGRLRDMKKAKAAQGREFVIGVTGCVAQAEGSEILRRAPAVDLVMGPQSYHRLPQVLRDVRAGGKAIETDYSIEDKFEHLPAPEQAATRARGPTAFLTVQEGCDKFCTFCVVPYTRGAEVSRPLEQIVEEARKLAAGGVRELTLLGQNVNAWHGVDADGNAIGLGRLIAAIAEIDGLDRLRYTTSHPRDMDDELIAAHATQKKLMPYLHLPVQSGSDRILKAMNRKHTAADYLALVKRIRTANPELALSGDFIVGFPGETDEDFEATMRLVEEVRYVQAFSFKYSPRPGTPGAEMDGHVPEDVKSERLERLQALLFRQLREYAAASVGKVIDLLLEKPGRMEGQLVGRSPWLQPVIIDTRTTKIGDKLKIGDIIKVRITEAGPNSLFAEVAQS
jgi:tRNA-2-methylthio-N6-dimethylallyladenosine synthase